MLQYQWQAKAQADIDIVNALKTSLQCSTQLATLLAQRGINNYQEAKSFFRPELKQLHDPFLFKDMDKAVEQIVYSIENKEKILIYGDYDVDGTTSVALVFSFLNQLNAICEYYIPDRYTEGYGLSKQGVDYAINNGFSLLITLDCGIRSVDLIEYANQNNIKSIICDHHIPGDILPNALAVLDAKRKDNTYPFDELSGCGVGFKLIQAISIKINLNEERYLQYIDLVAVSTCSDILPLIGENRTLVYFGIQKLSQNPMIGLKALIKTCLKKRELNVSDIVFYLGPRINAAGRIHDAKDAVKLLIADNETDAIDFCQILNNHNDERKVIDESITAEAELIALETPNFENKFTNVVYKEDWHKGVVGIVASRLIEKYYKPTIVLTKSEGKIVGSARSIKNFDLYNALLNCQKHLIQFGGHAFAAGLSLKESELDVFMSLFEQYTSSQLSKDDLIPKIIYDIELPLHQISPSFINTILQMAPFGPSNLSPIFLAKGVRNIKNVMTIGKQNAHLSFQVDIGNQTYYKVLAFGKGSFFDDLYQNKSFDMLYQIEVDTFRDQKQYHLILKDLVLN